MMSMHRHRYAASAAQIRHLGQAILHTNPEGVNEWLWGYFTDPIDSTLSAHEFDFKSNVPSVIIMADDAANICSGERRHAADAPRYSTLNINGFEYPVREVNYCARSGKAMIQLSENCQKMPAPLHAPYCADHCAADALKTDNNNAQTHSDPPLRYQCPD